MKNLEPNIRIQVDPTNPGQFFACCGLLELADRLWPGAEGWFHDNGREFNLTCSGTMRELLATLVRDLPNPIERIESNGLEIRPIIAPLAFNFGDQNAVTIVLDAWTRIQIIKGVAQVTGNPPWNFWSGQQTSFGIWSGLRTELTAQLTRLTESDLGTLFSQRLFQKGRFGFDPGPAWNPLDVGFSPNEHTMEVESSPAVEMLAVLGLQRFRPQMNDKRDGFDYFTWHAPCSPCVAAAAMAGGLRERRTMRYRGTVVSRGQYAALGFSYLIRQGTSDE